MQKWNKPLLPCTVSLLFSAFWWAREKYFSDVFRSYMSGNKSLTCENG